ncbi:MAG TPA: GNAT family protein [Vicinamibacterales bacterium]|nr:GNAT family protein [Vicinamibacterales bacterium]
MTPADRSPIGAPVDDTRARRPVPTTLIGRYATLVPLDPAAHAEALYEEIRGRDEVWLYLFEPPPPNRAAFTALLERKAASPDRVYLTVMDHTLGQAAGYASYLRIDEAHRSIEVGDILFTPAIQRTRAATDAMYLMARHAFEDLGYRRYEWKCNDLNAPSKRAAVRFGFTFEGVFRQHMIVKGRNRDTAWFAMLDADWPARKAAFERWLDPANFDAAGRQRVSLSAISVPTST